MIQFKKNKVKQFPVLVKYIFEWKGRVLDSSNCSYMVKLIEDGLVIHGIIPGDEPQYISEIQIRSQKRLENDVDMVTVEIYQDPSSPSPQRSK